MFEQGVVIHRYWGAQYHHGYHGPGSTNTDGLTIANGQIAEDHVNPTLQRRLHVRYCGELPFTSTDRNTSTCITSAVRVALLPPMLTSKDSSWDTVYPSLWM